MIVHGSAMSLFQASQQWSTMFVYERKMRFDSQLSRMYCQMFSTGLSSGHFGGSGTMVMFGGTISRVQMPSCLVHEKHSMSTWLDGPGDLCCQMQVHRHGVAAWQDERRSFAQRRTGGTEDVGWCGTLICWRGGSCGHDGPQPSPAIQPSYVHAVAKVRRLFWPLT